MRARNAFYVLGDFVGGVGALLGQRANFLRDDGEAATGTTGAGRFDGGVEREQVGLCSDFRDDADEIIDGCGGIA